MQIRNDYNSFSGTGYQHSHSHHITKCLHEEEHHQKQGAAAGMKQDVLSQGAEPKAEEKEEQSVVFTGGSSTEKRTGGIKKGLGIMKEVWDSMGDETGRETVKTLAMEKERPSNEGRNAVLSAIRYGISYRIINKWENIKGKIKVGIKSALKRFGRDSDTFGTLSDPKGRFTGKKDDGERYAQKAGKGTRKSRPDILTATMADTHLMDSYSKTGEYCRLNENLTYHQNKAAEKAGNQTENQP